MIPGIDLAGTVETSTHPEWKAGDKVILNGWGLGETHLGAYGEKARREGQLAGTASRRHERPADAHGRSGPAGYTPPCSR